MAIENVIAASSDLDLVQAWTSFLGRMVSSSAALESVAIRFVFSRRPKLTCEIATGPLRADMEEFLQWHPVECATATTTRVVPWKPAVVALELKELPAGVYATGPDDDELEDVVSAFSRPQVIEALEHSYRMLDKDVGHMKRMAMHSRSPCLLIDEEKHVHACNLAAKHLLHDCAGGLSVSAAEQLCFGSRGDSINFAEMLDAFFTGGHDEARTLLDKDLLATVARDKSSWVSGDRLALVHLKRLRQPLVLDPVRVSTITKLTLSQARLVCALVRGQEVKEYAEEAGLELSTARWHVRKALSRMECSSQYELVSLMKEIFG